MNRKTIEKTNETKSWLFRKINQSEKSLARLTKKKEDSTKIRNERGYYEYIYSNKLGKLDEILKTQPTNSES